MGSSLNCSGDKNFFEIRTISRRQNGSIDELRYSLLSKLINCNVNILPTKPNQTKPRLIIFSKLMNDVDDNKVIKKRA